MQFKKTAIALAVSSFCVSTVAFGNGFHGAPEVEFTKKVNIEEDVRIKGKIRVSGHINVRNSALAITDTNQSSTENLTDYFGVKNSARVSGDSLKYSSGNINVNVGSGDNNVQANSMAIAKTGPYLHGGAADAETFLFQTAVGNETLQIPAMRKRSWEKQRTSNNAHMSGSSLAYASGNIGVNIAAGTSNLQANSTALAVADDSLLATSTASTNQFNYYNGTWSAFVTNSASLSGDSLKGASGNIGVNIASGNNNAQSNSLALSRSSAPSHY